MSAPVQQASEDATGIPPGRRRHGKRRRRMITAAVVIVVIAGGGAGGYYGLKHLHKKAPASSANSDATGLRSVTRQTLSEQTSVNGTLGYSGNYTVVVPSGSSGSSGSSSSAGSSGSSGSSSSGGSSSGGTFTWLPAGGQVVRQGQRIYSVANSPVVLLYGSVPVYRDLSQGMSGPDVQQLNSDLVALGDAAKSELDPSSDDFSSGTATALEKLQSHLGLPQTGTLPLGQAVFQPSAVLVGNVSATLGAPVHPGTPVLTGTSDTRQAVAQADPTELPDVGANVSITLPDNQITSGVVTSVATTASSPSGGSGSGSSGSGSDSGSGSGSDSGSSSSSATTVNVYIRLTRPATAGTLDQAPVTVNITTSTVRNVLAVPIQALISEPGGYAVEVAGPHGTRHIVPVSLGLFDDAAGLVQVTGALTPGQQVVVPNV